MGLFYAYANSYTDDSLSRYIIIFPSRYIADEWWRALQDKQSSGKIKYTSIKRVTPQFYLYDTKSGTFAINQIVRRTDGTPEFQGKVIFTQHYRSYYQQVDIIPVQDIVDFVSGNLFFIRNRFDSSLCWHCNAECDGFIRASRTERTRFRISICPRGGDSYDGKIMIGSDNVQISLGSDDSKFVCAVGPEEAKGRGDVKGSSKEAGVGEGGSKGKVVAVVVSARFRGAEQAANLNDNVGREGNIVREMDPSKHGVLRLDFKFKEILDGLFGEWELA